jgi:hypothetical protein
MVIMNLDFGGKDNGNKYKINLHKTSLQAAINNAWHTLLGYSDTYQVRANDARVTYSEADNSFVVRFFNERYKVTLATQTIMKYLQNTLKEVEVKNEFEIVLILHYLVGAKPIEPVGELITFRELYGGNIYYSVFYNTAIAPIGKRFATSDDTIHELLRTGHMLGGKKVSLGHGAIEVPVFPRLPITVVVWLGDDEIPGSANMLFDKTANEHLHTEDLAKIGMMLCNKLIKCANKR